MDGWERIDQLHALGYGVALAYDPAWPVPYQVTVFQGPWERRAYGQTQKAALGYLCVAPACSLFAMRIPHDHPSPARLADPA